MIVTDVECLPTYRFDRSVEVKESQTAQQLFATLPHGASYAARLVPAMATGLLVATIESVCILEVQRHLAADETVVGTRVSIDHVGPALPGCTLSLRGRGQRRSRGAVRFDVVVDDCQEQVASAEVWLAVIDTARFNQRLARKASVIDCVERSAA